MILSEEGKYFFDKENKIPYEKKTHKEVLSQIFPNWCYLKAKELYKRIEGDVEFEFREYSDKIMVSSIINPKGTALNYHPLELSLKKKKGGTFISEEIDVFSKEQLDKILKNRNIEYPISNSVIVTEEVKERILNNTYYMKFEILNLPLKEIFKEKKGKQGSFGFLSKYINLYMKSEIDFNDNPEKEFFKKEDFTVKKEDKMDFYYSENDLRADIILQLNTIIKNGKSYFLAGPHDTGKTFTLLGFLSFEAENLFKYIYINLDILKKSKNKMEILFYEARNLFYNENDYITAFYYLKQNLKINSSKIPNKEFFHNLDDAIFSIIHCLVDYLEKNRKDIKMKYVFVIDQFNYRNDDNSITKFVMKLKEKIEKIANFSLIVCSSINYSGIKENIIMTINREIEIKLNYYYQNKLCDKPYIQNESKYLYLFGYLPRFCQINKMINKKYVNLMKKIIKKHFYKFYSDICEKNYSVEDYMIMKLKWIKNNNKLILSYEQFLEFIRKNPIKYFIIDIYNKTFDFLFPLVEIIIDEIIKSKELKDSRLGLYNEEQIEWYFEYSFFDKIKNENIFLNYYIENTIIIKTIFKKEKIENFDKNANTLFCFSISNVKRYNGAIYIADKDYVILIHASIYKSEKKLEQYTEANMKKDIEKMEKRFFKPNGIYPKKYYLIFILDYENYLNSKGNIDTLNHFDFNYCFYNPSKNLLYYEYIENFKLKEIRTNLYYISEEEEEKERGGFFFIKKENFKTIDEKKVLYKPGYYYVEKGIDLLSFLEETCNEFKILINYLYNYKSKYSKYTLKSYSNVYSSNINLNELCSSKIMIALNNKNFFFGESINNNINDFKDKYIWKKFNIDYFENEVKTLNKNEENILNLINGFFYFESF